MNLLLSGSFFLPLPTILDDTKLFLAKNGVCELVFDLVQKHMDEVVNENNREVLKMVCDMIVLVLTGGKYLSQLFTPHINLFRFLVLFSISYQKYVLYY